MGTKKIESFGGKKAWIVIVEIAKRKIIAMDIIQDFRNLLVHDLIGKSLRNKKNLLRFQDNSNQNNNLANRRSENRG